MVDCVSINLFFFQLFYLHFKKLPLELQIHTYGRGSEAEKVCQRVGLQPNESNLKKQRNMWESWRVLRESKELPSLPRLFVISRRVWSAANGIWK